MNFHLYFCVYLYPKERWLKLDCFKWKWCCYVILGLENQSKIHYAMPLRHMIGDAFSYLKEYKELEAKNKKYKNYKTKHEFLSKFQKTDRLHPIVTICIYYGEDEWDGPRSLLICWIFQRNLSH